MRKSLWLLIAFLSVTLAPAIHSQDLLISAIREIGRDSTETYDVTSLSAGELVAGTFEPRGISGTIDIFDAEGKKLQTFKVWDGKMRVGFVSPGPGLYRVKVSARPTESAGAYTLAFDRQSPSTRLNGRHVHPREDYQSQRIGQLIADIAKGLTNVEERFWAEVNRSGTPLVESIPGDDDHVFMTFVWKEIYETHNVLLVWPPTFYRADDYYMSHLPRTSVWHKTIRVRRGSRFVYGFSPNDLPEERDITSQHDPLNARRAYDEPDSSFSMVELSGAPDETWATMIPQRRGVVSEQTFKSRLLKGERRIWIYTPPDYSSDTRPHALVVLFNPPMYVGSGVGPTVLDNLAAAGKIRPAVVCFVQSDPVTQLLSSQFANAVATELVPQLRSTYRISPDAKELVIGGFSANAVWGAYIALQHSNVFGNVLSQSGAFRLRLPGKLEPNSLSSMFAGAPRAPLRFFIDSGLYEPFPSAQNAADESALDESNTAGNRHFRDVLLAKGYDVIYRETGGGHEQLHWRATLADGLITLLPPR